ncbi:MAG: nucleotidyltransferase domain-containing protein [Candidatus Parvarchaeota archaeon]|nr:nucleotidyltransferase domain-containing protein [Candidatus Jingweiarchaeum tengchongense]MCW1298288.1 nucleotidyltransferase domain-containing protein [Candidatus Jingweiarchaeum tengchongense]MCW1300379.1 nucleotidyltransferase domain-containing protein [Candidatus Jingweiarchaeum tengchongense]MCW1304776.1 nucleotidyltransferase domain-containing protein [Candidatus Jingweiarchaeum tengchongense]MCW1305366.1 nucleotidyltransferase domain-containing protein [Candidatus Jingweiarchaeum ten
MTRKKKEEEKKEETSEEVGEEGEEAPKPSLVSDFLAQKDARDVQTYTQAVVQKFGKYIKSVVVWGSQKTGIGKKRSSDIDIAIIVDDTDVRRMTRPELKEKLFQRLCEMGFPISKKIHPQPYLLTEFWEYIREGNPVLYNVLRDGIVVFDTGFFLPIQMLMKAGNITPSKEAIDKHITVANELLKLTKDTITTKLTYDLEQAVVASTQAVLMELGYRPPAPREIPSFVKEILVDKEKLVDEGFYEIARDVIKLYKDVEHKEKKEVSGEEIDKYYKLTEEYVKKMSDILANIRKEKGEKWLFEVYEKAERKEIKRDGIITLERKEDIDKKAEKLIKEDLGQR